MKTLLHRTSTLALATALIALGAQAGQCRSSLNPQPLPPRYMLADLHHLLSFAHLIRF